VPPADVAASNCEHHAGELVWSSVRVEPQIARPTAGHLTPGQTRVGEHLPFVSRPEAHSAAFSVGIEEGECRRDAGFISGEGQNRTGDTTISGVRSRLSNDAETPANKPNIDGRPTVEKSPNSVPLVAVREMSGAPSPIGNRSYPHRDIDHRVAGREAEHPDKRGRRWNDRNHTTPQPLGTISSLYGLNAGIIDKTQFSLLVTVVVLSAIIPTAIAQVFFSPGHISDIEHRRRAIPAEEIV
jgi:hypothetical protein